jgi:acyl-CoA synthetase (NDP forming)
MADHRTRDAFTRMLDPASVAIVGLSEDPSKHGGRVLGHLRRLGFPGDIWGVNPRLPRVEGVEMYSSVSSLPHSPDVVVCATPAATAVGITCEAGEKGAGVVIVFAGAFAEAGSDGQRLQDELLAAARSSGVRVLGPNSGGVIRPAAGAALSFLTCLDRPVEQIRSGPVGLVTQSGGTGSYLHNLAAARGSGFAASISTGNEVDLDAADAIDALIDLADIKAIAVVLETVRHGPEFLSALRRARQNGKPVIVCRLGRSERGQRLMVTHTGALARPSRVLDGVLDAEGVTVTETPGDLVEVAEILARTSIPAGKRTGVVSHSGGIAILLSDLADRADLVLPTPSSDLRARLQPLLELGVADNPLDMGGIIGGPHRFAQVVEAFTDSDEYDMVLAVSTAHPPAHTPTRVQDLVSQVSPKPVVHLWMAGDLGEAGLTMLRAAGKPVAEEPRAAIAALAGLARLVESEPLAGEPATPLLLGSVTGSVTEHEAKHLLRRLGVPVVDGDVASTPEDAIRLAARLGYPVVVKVNSPDIPHKSKVGAIRLGLEDEESVKRAFNHVLATSRVAVPEARLDGVLVERYRPGIEIEMIVGAVRDPVFGPVTLVGLGGSHTEMLGDVAIAPAPVTRAGSARMVTRLAARKLLSDVDLDSLYEIVALVSRYLALSQLDAIEINPLVWTGEKWEALDALVRKGSATRGS